MLNRIPKVVNYILYILWTNIIYGLILYWSYTWLAGYSLILAYFGNLALIVLGLALDELILKMYQSEKFVMELKKDMDAEKGYRLVQWLMDNFVSFKTVLYLFYLFILIASQIIDSNPALLGEGLRSFILANSYSILLLIAFDVLIGQFSKDREKMQKISAKLKKSLTED